MHLKSTLFAAVTFVVGIRPTEAWYVGFLDFDDGYIPKSGGVDNHCCKFVNKSLFVTQFHLHQSDNMNDLGYGDWNDKAWYALINDASCVFWAYVAFLYLFLFFTYDAKSL
jgi:hypothetical protein